tara:strand:+ start:1117 stop:1290 length:174 start_codon:yes stop_codon:yes gene_type:complete
MSRTYNEDYFDNLDVEEQVQDVKDTMFNQSNKLQELIDRLNNLKNKVQEVDDDNSRT